MDDTLLFIPPCCVDKKLPKAITQAPHRSLLFYTHGDVTMEKIYRAISYLVESAVMVLTLPVIERDTVVFLQQCFERGWITDLVLSTNTDANRYVIHYLSEYSNHIVYTVGKDVSDSSSHLVLYTTRQALVINGPMLCRASLSTLVSYTAMYYPSLASFSLTEYGNPLLNVLLPDILRLRRWSRENDVRGKSLPVTRLIKCELPPYQV